MPILTRREIEVRLHTTDLKEKLVITPLLDEERQVTLNGVDVRLGTEFIVIRRTNLVSVDPSRGEEFEENLGRYHEKVQLNYGERFILHPGDLVLGCTLEYIGLPEGICGQILGRSSWGRLGLITATAPFIGAGFKGVVTLELENLGQLPLEVYPGYMIAHLILQDTSSVVQYRGKYSHPTSVELARLAGSGKEEEFAFWSSRQNFEPVGQLQI